MIETLYTVASDISKETCSKYLCREIRSKNKTIMKYLKYLCWSTLLDIRSANVFYPAWTNSRKKFFVDTYDGFFILYYIEVIDKIWTCFIWFNWNHLFLGCERQMKLTNRFN